MLLTIIITSAITSFIVSFVYSKWFVVELAKSLDKILETERELVLKSMDKIIDIVKKERR